MAQLTYAPVVASRPPAPDPPRAIVARPSGLSSPGWNWFDNVSPCVELGFGTGAGTAVASTVWTDVTPFVRELSWRWGATPDNPQQVQPSSAQLLLDNRDRRFDPFYSAGPYFGQLLPMVRLRIRVAWNGLTYEAFSGFVEAWPQVYDYAHGDSTVPINAFDAFAVLAGSSIDTDTTRAALYAIATPLILLRGDGTDGGAGHPIPTVGRVNADAVLNGSGSSFNFETQTPGNTSTSAVTALPWSPSTAIAMPGVDIGAGGSFTVVTGGTGAEAAATLAGWMRFPTPTSGTMATEILFDVPLRLYLPGSAGAASSWLTLEKNYILVGGTWQVQVRVSVAVSASASTVNTWLDVFKVPCDMWLPLVVPITSSPTIRVGNFVEALPVAAVGLGSNLWTSLTSLALAGPLYSTATGYTLLWDELAVFNTALPVATFANLFLEAGSARVNESPASRLGWMLDQIGWPASDRDLDVGNQPMGPLRGASSDAATQIRRVTDSDRGWFLMGPGGKATYRSRHRLYGPSLAVFGDATAGELPYVDVTPELNMITVRNLVQATNDTTGLTSTAADATSQTAYLQRSETFAVSSGTDEYAAGIAGSTVTRWKAAVPRITSILIRPRLASALALLAPQVLGRQLGDVVEVRRRPFGIGAPIDQLGMILGCEQAMSAAGEWTCKWYLLGQPAGAWWTIGDPVLGRIGAAAGNRIPY